MVDYSPALMTDMYEYTMLDASLKDGTANRKCVFEVYTRHLPEGRRYGVVAGIGRILDELSRFLLSDEDLRFLSDRKVVSKETISWLENLHFSGSIKGYREGEMFFPNSPILQVEGTFGECTLLETLVLSVLNYDSAVASAASRMVSAAKDRPCMDMGGRRTNEWAAVAAARAAVIGGFQGTANLLAAHERVLYEKTLKSMKTREFTSQMISPPIVLNLSMQEAELLNTYMDQFTRIGFEIEEFGQDSYAVRAVPDNLFSIAKKELLIQMLDSLSDEITRNQSPDLIDEKIASMSCKAAVKGNMKLSVQEVDALIGELLSLDNP